MARSRDHYITRKFLEPWMGDGDVVRNVWVVSRRAKVMSGKRGVGGVMREKGFYRRTTEKLLQKNVEVNHVWDVQRRLCEEGAVILNNYDMETISRFIGILVIRTPRMKAIADNVGRQYGYDKRVLWNKAEDFMTGQENFAPFVRMLVNGKWTRYVIGDGPYTFSIGLNNPVYSVEIAELNLDLLGCRVLDIPVGPRHLVRIEYTLADVFVMERDTGVGEDKHIQTLTAGQDFVATANERCIEDWEEDWWSCICADDITVAMIRSAIENEPRFKMRRGYNEM